MSAPLPAPPGVPVETVPAGLGWIVSVVQYLSGKKTYVLGFAAVVVTVLSMTGVMPPDLANRLLELLGAGSILTIRAAISKMNG